MFVDSTVLQRVRARGLSQGNHSNPDDGFCVMEAAAMLRQLPFNDHPQCVSVVIRRFMMRLNDSPVFAPFRNELIDYIDPSSGKPLVYETAADFETERRRAYMLADWSIRTVAPMALDVAGLAEHAKTLRALDPVVDAVSAQRARDTALKARAAARYDAADAAYAAAYAAYAAAYAAAAAAYAAAAAADAAADAARKRAATTIEPRALWNESLRALQVLISFKPEPVCATS